MKRCMGAFWRNQSGATAIEYAMIGALVSIVCVAALRIVGTNLSTKFTTIGNALK